MARAPRHPDPRARQACDVEVVLLEHPDYFHAARVPAGATCVLGDLADGGGDWVSTVRGADAFVHFSAVNPYPNASWEESAGSMSHAFNAFLACERLGVRRVVFASSNHVCGGYALCIYVHMFEYVCKFACVLATSSQRDTCRYGGRVEA